MRYNTKRGKSTSLSIYRTGRGRFVTFARHKNRPMLKYILLFVAIYFFLRWREKQTRLRDQNHTGLDLNNPPRRSRMQRPDDNIEDTDYEEIK